MKKILFLLLALSLIAVAACGGPKEVAAPVPATPQMAAAAGKGYVAGSVTSAIETPAGIVDFLKEGLVEQIVSQGKAPKPGVRGVEVNVEIIDWRVVPKGARVFVGVWMGKDFIKSRVTLTDPASGKSLGSFEATTTITFAFGQEKSIAFKHAEELAAQLP